MAVDEASNQEQVSIAFDINLPEAHAMLCGNEQIDIGLLPEPKGMNDLGVSLLVERLACRPSATTSIDLPAVRRYKMAWSIAISAEAVSGQQLQLCGSREAMSSFGNGSILLKNPMAIGCA